MVFWAAGCISWLPAPSLQPPVPAFMKHRLEYLAVRLLIGAMRFLPSTFVSAAGALIGRTVYLLDRKHRRIADKNVAAAFPARSAAERRRIVRGAFQHFGRLLFELLKFSTL